MARAEDHNCLFCGAFFRADARNAKHQKYCSNRLAAKRARRQAGAPGWPKRRTGTTFGGLRMSRGCSHGERLIPGTGGGRAVKGRRCLRRRLRYKISARRRTLKSLKILKACRTMRYKISGAINRLF